MKHICVFSKNKKWDQITDALYELQNDLNDVGFDPQKVNTALNGVAIQYFNEEGDLVEERNWPSEEAYNSYKASIIEYELDINNKLEEKGWTITESTT